MSVMSSMTVVPGNAGGTSSGAGVKRRGHPATSQREYTPEELRFLHAVEAKKRSVNRAFLTAIEYLDVALSIGYAIPQAA